MRRLVVGLFSFVLGALSIAGCGSGSPGKAIRLGFTAEGAVSYRVQTGSMEPTLPIGTRVILSKRSPTVGAIVVFHPPENAEEEECGPKPHVVSPGGAACDSSVPQRSTIEFIKRIVAGPGDEIFVRHGHVSRKAEGSGPFVRESEPYIRACGSRPECDFPDPIKIPPGRWFLMGDNRGESDDSRFWGPIPTAWIVGVAAGLECPRLHGGLSWVRRSLQEGCSGV